MYYPIYPYIKIILSMKNYLSVITLLMISSISSGQVPLTIEGTTTNNTTTGDWSGINVSRSVPTTFTFRNNSVTSVNVSGYMLQAGDEVVATTNNNLQGEVISGNKFVWNGTDMTSITHGVFTGFNINAVLIYNYCYKVPMALVRKSNGMTNTAGGVAYNIVNMTNATAVVVKGMNGVQIYNNTFYSTEKFYSSAGNGTWRGLVDIYTNTDIKPNAPSTGTKVKNNIFYTKNLIYNISVSDAACLAGFESDYNIFYCESGSPIFNYAGSLKTFEQWQALGYDTHSIVINPNFIDFTNFVPTVRLDYGTDLGAEWQAGLATTATWTAGISPETASQNGTWQVGARVYTEPGTACIPPSAPVIGTITQPTCAVPTGSFVLNGLPSSGSWMLTQSPGGKTTGGSGTSITISGVSAGTYTYTVTNAAGCVSLPSGNIVINAVANAPSAPVVGTITQTSCTVSTGSVVLNGLPASGTWTLKVTPGSTSVSGTGTTYTYKSLTAGTYTFTVTNSSGCVSTSSAGVVINARPLTPSAPKIGTISQPTCSLSTGSVMLSGLPSAGVWILTRSPGGTTTTGTGTTLTVTGLPGGSSYTFKVTSEGGCTSSSSSRVTINSQPSTPKAPVVGTITQPTLTLATGSVALSGLPSSGTWSLTRLPGGTTTSGRGTTKTVTGLPAGFTYTFTVKNSSGCSSVASSNVVINAQPKSLTSKSLSNSPPVSIETLPEEDLPHQISVYPNPFTGAVNISYDDDNYTNINIINSSGTLVGKEKAFTPVQQLDLSALKPGLYILEFTKPDRSVVRIKILKN
jgi:hypothetical protein